MLNSMSGYRFVRLLCIATLLASGLPFSAWSQTDLSLRDMISQALEQNYQIRIYKNIARTAENNNTRGNAGMYPTVGLVGEHRRSISNSRQEFFTGDSQERNNAHSNATTASLEVNWIVFDGLAMFARKEQFEQLQLLSEADTRFFMEETVADLAMAYFELKQQTQLLDTYRKTLDVSRARLDFEEKALEIGTSNLLNVQLARVDLNTDSSLVLNQEARVQEIAVSINRLINRELTAAVRPVDSIRLDADLNLSELLENARAKNTALDRQYLAELVAASETKIVKGALFPRVELYGNYDFGRQQNEVGFLQSSRTFGPEYGVRVRFNLFSGRQNRIAHQNALIEQETEKLRTQDLDKQLEESIRIAHLRWQSRVRQAELESENMQAAALALDIARGQYELAALTNVEFRVIQLNVVNAETRLLEAQYAAKIREIELLRLSGALLERLQ
ncbi:MAG: TolC family protein [Lewinellaceae bacterium]|nr:TolC family protein [Lewinellaceae bacterium]